MSLHCRCWNDAEPCCWCLDDTVDEELMHVDSSCSRSRGDHDCLGDLDEEIRYAEDQWYEANEAKRAALKEARP